MSTVWCTACWGTGVEDVPRNLHDCEMCGGSGHFDPDTGEAVGGPCTARGGCVACCYPGSTEVACGGRVRRAGGAELWESAYIAGTDERPTPYFALDVAEQIAAAHNSSLTPRPGPGRRPAQPYVAAFVERGEITWVEIDPVAGVEVVCAWVTDAQTGERLYRIGASWEWEVWA